MNEVPSQIVLVHPRATPCDDPLTFGDSEPLEEADGLREMGALVLETRLQKEFTLTSGMPGDRPKMHQNQGSDRDSAAFSHLQHQAFARING